MRPRRTNATNSNCSCLVQPSPSQSPSSSPNPSCDRKPSGIELKRVFSHHQSPTSKRNRFVIPGKINRETLSAVPRPFPTNSRWRISAHGNDSCRRAHPSKTTVSIHNTTVMVEKKGLRRIESKDGEAWTDRSTSRRRGRRRRRRRRRRCRWTGFRVRLSELDDSRSTCPSAGY